MAKSKETVVADWHSVPVARLEPYAGGSTCCGLILKLPNGNELRLTTTAQHAARILKAGKVRVDVIVEGP